MYGRILAGLLAGILPFLFVFDCYSAPTKFYIHYDKSKVVYRNNLNDKPKLKPFGIKFIPYPYGNNFNIIWDMVTRTSQSDYYIPNVSIYYCSNDKWNKQSILGDYVWPDAKSYLDSHYINNDTFPSESCTSPTPCDNKDSDGDGVCDSCDKRPGEYDPRDCVTSRSYDSATNKIIGMSIDEGCTGKSDKFYQSNSPVIGTPYTELPHSSNRLYEIPPANCNGTDENGQCSCAYKDGSDLMSNNSPPPSNFDSYPALPNTADPNKPDPTLEPTQPVANPTAPPGTSTPDESIKNDPTPDTGSNNEERNAENLADIEEAICQTNYEIQKLSKALEDKQLSQIERQDIQIQIARNIEILQRNQNRLAESTNDKLKLLNSNLDRVNNNLLDGINITNRQGDAIQGKLDGIKDSVNNIGGKLDGIGTALNGLKDGISEGTGKLDGIGKSLQDIKDKLGEVIKPEGSAPLPDDNAYDPNFEKELEEEPFAENVKNFINSGLPFSGVFKGTKINSSSSNAKLSFDAYGKTVVIDFSKYESVYDFMGRVLIFCCLVLSLMIIIGRIK